ncbi:MAG: hypothetical protein ACRETW_08450 [Stenotrophobium sp.]
MLALTATVALPASAHMPEPGDVQPRLGALPKAWAGITAQVQQTLAPQIVIENRSGRMLEILDANGRAFLRLGPEGAQGDFGAAAWYQTYSTAGMPVPEAARSPQSAQHWITVSRDPAWGWFDPRLNPHKVRVSHAIRHAGRKTRIGAWDIPVRLNGVSAALRGNFVYAPRPRGVFEARLTSTETLPPELSLSLVQGTPPALFLSNRGAEPVTIVGLDGEPYLRIGPAGVEINLRSRTWRQYGRNQGLHRAASAVAGASATVEWMRVSKHSSYAWLEPRSCGIDGRASILWQVPLIAGTRSLNISGVTTWIPLHADRAHRD